MEGALEQSSQVVSTGLSPAFFVTLVLYLIATVLYASVISKPWPLLKRAARWVLALAFVAHAVDIGWRGVEQVHPATSVRESLGFLAWLMVGGYLMASLRQRLQVLGAFVAPAAIVILAAARLSPSGEALPGLTQLGRIHISLATLGVAIFALATLLSVLYLIENRSLKRKQFDGFFFRRGVALESLDLLAHRLVLVGFPIFTLAIILGVIWVSQRASGFDRAEYPLALVTWISFAGLIVTRTTHGWRGRRAAWLTIVGFISALLVFAIYLARRSIF
ncbi:cytochrome C assembly family protein [Haliangium ochraceum]|uniref:Cytochrome c assembly protein n=1 Tax=Haliangium ochraceum (strain DSM 14365 / JCM 11303 / SMP-2) TaxID=502025 RepID=D0LUD9_HALO1|nr:cytochrome c biogenesis protein CcsA [Haliangium ochraceum]ACY19262.1 cytochrome c assembly protein [Haliangium ochraceum DSM 14365]